MTFKVSNLTNDIVEFDGVFWATGDLGVGNPLILYISLSGFNPEPEPES